MTSEQSTRRLDTPRVNRRPSFHVDSDLIGMYACLLYTSDAADE